MRALVMVVMLGSSAAHADDGPDRFRHHIGVQIGGTGVIQFAYRVRTIGPVYLDFGGAGAPGAINGSAGVTVQFLEQRRFFLYAGAGGGTIGAFGVNAMDETESSQKSFGYARLGASVRLGHRRAHILGLDFGFWKGVDRERVGDRVIENESFSTPMVGISYLRGI